MMRIHGFRGSGNCYKVELALRLLGLEYEWIEHDILAGATRTDAFLAVNPNGRIPVLELADGRVLPESNAILCYLADDTPLMPEDRFRRAQVLQWLFFEQYSHEPHIAVARFIHRYLGNPPGQAERAQRCVEPGYAALGVMEQHLVARRYFVGEAYSIADIALYAYTHVAHEGGFSLDHYPAVRAWLDRVASRPGHIPMEGPRNA